MEQELVITKTDLHEFNMKVEILLSEKYNMEANYIFPYGFRLTKSICDTIFGNLFFKK
jgi:hypothetical protein